MVTMSAWGFIAVFAFVFVAGFVLGYDLATRRI